MAALARRSRGAAAQPAGSAAGTGAPGSGRGTSTAPLKTLDRLLSNQRLQQARGGLYGAALQRLWPCYRTVIVVDGCVLNCGPRLSLGFHCDVMHG